MSKTTALLSAAALSAALMSNPASAASVYITEWMYNGLSAGNVGEYIEFTNLGSTAIDFTGWSFDDDSRTAGTVDLSAFGIVNSGESVILAEASAAAFISTWGLSGVDVIGGNTTNLSRGDEINLYDANGTLVDRLTYSDQNQPGTIRTQNVSGNPDSFSVLETPYDASGWVLSSQGDTYGSYLSTGGDVGNPGIAPFAPVPLPAGVWLLISGIAGLFGFGRRKSAI